MIFFRPPQKPRDPVAQQVDDTCPSAIPQPPRYLIREQVDEMCRSLTFEPNKILRELLKFIVEETLSGEQITEAILATRIWGDSAMDKTKVRVNLTRLRERIDEYYKLIEAQTAIVVIAIPLAGLNRTTREFKHYEATFSFHSGMTRSASAFANALNYKYDVPTSDGEMWFSTGLEPVSLLRSAVRRHKARALLITSLHLLDYADEALPLVEQIVKLYDMADRILECTTKEGLINRGIQVQVAVPFATQTIYMADTLVSNYVEVSTGRSPLTEVLKWDITQASESFDEALHKFVDLMEQKLMPSDTRPEETIQAKGNK